MTKKYLKKDEEAQVGIGTMIVFIATILVAAVAAGVLIDTSQKLQSKSTQTGNAATEAVGNAMEFQAIYGFISAGTTIDRLDLWVELAAGSEPINLEELIIQFKDGDDTFLYEYEDNDLSTYAGTLRELAVYGQDNQLKAGEKVLEAGELHKLVIGGDATGGTSLDLATSEKVTIELIPEVGVTIQASFSTPGSYGSKTYFELF